MRRFVRWFSLVGMITIIGIGLLTWTQPVIAANISTQPTNLIAVKPQVMNAKDNIACPDFEQKIDLNNANIIAFKDCQGFYPTLATLIIKNSPYQKTEDILKIQGLNDRQKQLLKSQLKNFVVSEPRVSLEMRMPPRPVMR